MKKATEYIGFMRQKNVSHTSDIQDLRRQNQHLENQVEFAFFCIPTFYYVADHDFFMLTRRAAL